MQCSVDGCERDIIVARGLCGKHYQRWRLKGSPTAYSAHDPNEIRTEGDVAFVVLRDVEGTAVGEVIVDRPDLSLVESYKWYRMKGRYAYYAASRTGSRKRLILMHRIILGDDQSAEVDHRNRNGLDNRRANLRWATRSQNAQNTPGLANTSSRFKGVSWNKNAQKWKASIFVGPKCKHIGYFSAEEDAALAYNKEVHLIQGEFAYLNEVR